jgi:hypothetical protein
MMHAALAMSLLLAGRPDLGALYRSARTYDRAGFRFKASGDEALARMRALVARVVRALLPGDPPEALVAEARAAGLVLAVARDEAGVLWVLREPDGRRSGDGFYAFRAGGAPLCIQAPHTFFDEGTGEIALALFARLKAGGLFVNTVHRYAEGDRADVAHAEKTLFAAANHGLLDAGRWPIVQVHGFGPGQGLPAEVKAVVADGLSARPAAAPAVHLRAALAAALGAGSVRLFGDDATVLGATTNVEGKAARTAGAVFLHIEMSAATRRAMGKDVAPLATALGETLRLRP